MKEDDLKVFLQGVVHYYEQTTGMDVEVQAPYLVNNVPEALSDYTGRIHITGGYTGDVLFTAPHRMLVSLLARYGQKDAGTSYLLDLVGEIANIIAGYAREDFGDKFDLSTPTVSRGKSIKLSVAKGTKAYCIPVNWDRQQARLIIAVA